MIGVLDSLRERAGRLKTDTYALYLVARDPRTPWYAKLLAALVAAYAFSPIDLIPDFIPVLGYLDDLVIVPLGIWAAVRLVPQEVMADSRAQAARDIGNEHPVSRTAAVIVVVIWIALAGVGLAWVYRLVGRW